MELVLGVAAIAQRYRFALAPGHQVSPDPQFTLRPKGGMPMTLHRRP